MFSDLHYELLSALRDALQAAPRGQRAPKVEQAAALMGCSVQTVYRQLKAVAGFDAGRKQRRDAGECVLSMDQLRLVSGVLRASYNNKDQRMPIQTALDVVAASCHQRGEPWPQVSASTVSRQLYANRLHPEQLALPTECVQMTSNHPNHVWQLDSTTGAYYYMPGGRLRWMEEAECNKNKVANLVKHSTDLLTRYSMVDHTSHAMKMRYFLGGETTSNLLEFLVWAMWQQDSGPMWGVPLILMADRGPANKSHLMAEFCKRLGIELILHAAGNARATGSVEKSHDLARMHLETRFRFEDPASVTLEKLNENAQAWCSAYCATRVHTRHGRTRFGAWMEINRYPGALRVAASLEALREAATSRPETPRVGNDKRINFKGRPYRLHMVPGVVAGLKVTVQTNVFRAPAIDVQFIDPDTGAETWHVVEPEVLNEWGYDGERVIGEGLKAVRNSVLDDNRATALRQAYRTGDGLPTLEEAAKARKAHAQAYAGMVDAMADVKATEVPAYLPRRTTPLGLPGRTVEARRLNPVEACKRLKDMLGAAYTPQVFAHVNQHFADGLPETELDAVAALFSTVQPAVENRLRVVGGEQ